MSINPVTFELRAQVAATILAGLLSRDRPSTNAVVIASAVRATEDLLEALERSPHGSFPDET